MSKEVTVWCVDVQVSTLKKLEPWSNLNELPELFSKFFSNKVQTVRDHLNKLLSEVDQDSPYAHDNQFSGCPLNSFTPISENSLRKIILQCAPKTCELDAIPTSFLFWMLGCNTAYIDYCCQPFPLHWRISINFSKQLLLRHYWKRHHWTPRIWRTIDQFPIFLLLQKCLRKLCYLKYCNT